jgi:RHS repeat-associated protein
MYQQLRENSAKDSQTPTGSSSSTSTDTFRISAPAISLPKGGGAVRDIGEKFSANAATGTGSLSVPVPLSPGRGGFSPELSLQYDSGSGNGCFGLGWSLSVPKITRRTDKGLPLYDDNNESDVFLLSGTEDLVPRFARNSNGEFIVNRDGSFKLDESRRDIDGFSFMVREYIPRTEGLFARIERWTNVANGEIHWRSISKDNVTTLYGARQSTDNDRIESQIADPSAPNRVFEWLICKSWNDKGNAMHYRYVAENSDNVDVLSASEANRSDLSRSSNRHLKRILYGNKRSLLADGNEISPLGPQLSDSDWLFEAVLDYDEDHLIEPQDSPLGKLFQVSLQPKKPWSVRPDAFSKHRSCFEIRSYRRCARILMFHHFEKELGTKDYLVRSLDLKYGDDSNEIASHLVAITQSGYKLQPDGSYLRKSLPPIELEYSRSPLNDVSNEGLVLTDIQPEALENLPEGTSSASYQWADLDGEGISGVLAEQNSAWYYKANLGNGSLESTRSVNPQASLVGVANGQRQLLDLDGDGHLDLVGFQEPVPGYYKRTDDRGWESFRNFRTIPRLEWSDPNIRFADITGDGFADVLKTEGDSIQWYKSLGSRGFDNGIRVRLPQEENQGPTLLFSDASNSVFLADMSGDGLTDLVRITNGEVCYWPNQGYGKFGRKVTMDNSPWLDQINQFDPRRLYLVDTDGSGAADIVYHSTNGVQIYLNQSGNSWSTARQIPSVPPANPQTSLQTADLLGMGTTCLVWSSSLPSDARRSMKYIDLMNGQKPYLLTKIRNNLGAETVISYASSTKFYLADKAAGKPWITKLPFPVHVVEHSETYDHISGNRFVTRYTYHHGYFDGVEREFRGFGMVEQYDTEEIGSLKASDSFPTGTNVDPVSHIPPTLTRSWFHTGVFRDRDGVSNYFAGLIDSKDHGEYYREPRLADDVQAKRLLLDDTTLPPGLSIDEEREACRALRGSMLRQEVYAIDGTGTEEYPFGHPYVVTEQNFTIALVQPTGNNPYAVFFSHPREAISYHYERDPDNARVSHTMTVEVDQFGNVLKSASVGYKRRNVDTTAPPEVQAEQRKHHITWTENRFTNALDKDDVHRTPLPAESRTYELTGYNFTGGRERFEFDDLVTFDGDEVKLEFDSEIAYEETATTGTTRRLIEHVRTLYRRDNLDGALPLTKLESLAIPFESYKQAFTPGLLTAVYDDKVTEDMLIQDGRFVHSERDDNWWIRSGQSFFIPQTDAAPDAELTFAREHFFLPHRFRDPFHIDSRNTDSRNTETLLQFDDYDLLILETKDALDNRVTAGTRNPDHSLAKHTLDYRVLQPKLLMDPNRNRTAVAFDALGMVVATAVMAKPEETSGDDLDPDEIEADLPEATIKAHLAQPLKNPQEVLGKATTRLIYDLFAFANSKDSKRKLAPTVYTLARESHASDLADGEESKIQHSFSYSDGFGREIQKKIQAEPGPVPDRDADGHIIVGTDGQPQRGTVDVSPRWVGTGWTIFNNKGKPVRQYEPFFTDRHLFEAEVKIGVSSILFYDPPGRVVATLHPNHTWEKVVFDPWYQESWDVNDTVDIDDPSLDEHVGDYFKRLPKPEYFPTWYTKYSRSSDLNEQQAASKAAVHAQTPTVAHLDSLGRTIVTVAHNKFETDTTTSEEFYKTRTVLDIEGNQRSVIDALDRIVMKYDYDMLGNRIHSSSMEAGERWMLLDVTNKPIYTWDSRGHEFRNTFDVLQRPIQTFLTTSSEPEKLVEQICYGESQPDPENRNLRLQVFAVRDQAGYQLTSRYDFKNNLLLTERFIAKEYKQTLDWNTLPDLEDRSHETISKFDALNRPVELITPDQSLVRPTYNEANLLDKVDVWLGSDANPTPFVTNINYNEKGQRTQIEYGNGVKTAYSYDPLTYRLTRMASQKGDSIRADLQDLRYTYDPVGNITAITDAAQQTLYFNNQVVSPSCKYTYDAVYRLIDATGREHIGQNGNPPNAYDLERSNLPQPGDGNAVGLYREQYIYDAVGNFLEMQHRGTSPSTANWNRRYTYNETSQTGDGKKSNRLSSTSVGSEQSPYRYDNHGNMIEMPHLSKMDWDYRDRLIATSRTIGSAAETTFYTYDLHGERVRKITESSAGTKKQERIYVGRFEVYREYNGDGTTVSLERETLHVMDDKQRIALVERRTQGTEGEALLIRFQMSNHLGTACLELDQSADIISYEEYTPYGSTAYQAVRAGLDKNPKRYRYTGKERDEENGFSYHGARYYATWLGRWTSSDPASVEDDINTYCFVGSQPVNRVDPDGRSWKDFGKGVLVGAATALVIGGTVALIAATAPITIPASLVTGLVVGGVAASGYTLVQSARERDILNRPISAEQAHFQAGTVVGGLVVAAGSGPISSGMSRAATSAQESATQFVSGMSPLPAMGPSVTATASQVVVPGVAVTAGGLIESVAAPMTMSSMGGGDNGDNDLGSSKSDNRKTPETNRPSKKQEVAKDTSGPPATSSAKPTKMFGSQGTKIFSKTIWKGKDGMRIDIENPNPGQRPGQIHFQQGEAKYLYDMAAKTFKDAPRAVNDLLNNSEVKRSLVKGLRFLGEKP